MPHNPPASSQASVSLASFSQSLFSATLVLGDVVGSCENAGFRVSIHLGILV